MEPGELRAEARRANTRWRRHSAGSTPSRRCAIAASFTASQVVGGLGTALLDAGIDVSIDLVEPNQIFQVCLDPGAFAVADVDDLIVLWRIEDLFERDLLAWSSGDDAARDRLSGGVVSLGAALRSLSEHFDMRLTIGDAPIPVGFGFDHHDPSALFELTELAGDLNREFAAALGSAPSVERFRLSAVQQSLGSTVVFDPRGWLMHRQPFVDWASFVVGRELGHLIGARTRPAPKVLVLDCDNTIWDGVAADDGIGGLSAGDAFPGRAFQEFQRVVQRLAKRGIMVALASKNDAETVAEAFSRVEGMVLTDSDIAARRISWEPKPDGIAQIADELNIALDAVVFVDDSPFEVGSVSDQLPDVRCLLVPEDIEHLPDLISTSGLFRNLKVSGDDRARTERIRAEAARSAVADSPAMTHEEFLDQLGLEVELIAVDDDQRARCTQLVNKSNRFNLTTIRRDEAAIHDLVVADDVEVLAAAARDRYGEYGLIGVVIARRRPGDWLLDTFVMSCRVLGRGVETSILALVVDHLRQRERLPIVGRYVPTDRNDMVADLYPQHGFEPIDSGTNTPTTGDPPTGAGPATVDGDFYVLSADATFAAPRHVSARTIGGMPLHP